MNNRSLIKGRYRPEIDGLRAFAVVAVIINHFNKELLPGGYLGVDIFFVISGYVITSSLAGRQNKNFWEFIIGFYERRIKRLIPLLVVFVVITSFIICLFNPNPSTTLKTGISALFGLSNLYLLKASTDYFAQSTELNVFTHTWSLGVEEQFYFLFPFIIWFTGFGRQTKNSVRNLFLSVLFLVICSLIIFIYFYAANQPAAYFLMPTRFWEIATGCLIFLGIEKRIFVFKKLDNISCFLILFAIVGIMFLPITLAVPSTILIVFLSALLIIFLKEGTYLFLFFTNKKVMKIGLLSYSLYLWHWSIISISRWTIGIYWWSIPFQIGLIYLISIYSYKWIENPLRKKDWSSKKSLTILKGLFTIIISVIPLIGLKKELQEKLYLGDKKLITTINNTLLTPINIDNQNKQFGGIDCFITNNSEVGKLINYDKCTLGDFENSKKRILIVGNSLSAAFAASFKEIVDDDFSVLITSAWGASPLKGMPNNTKWSKANKYYWEELVPTLIDKLKKGDIVFAINELNYDFDLDFGTPQMPIEILENSLKDFSNNLSSKSLNFVFLHNLPYVRDTGCKPFYSIHKSWFNPFGTSCKPKFLSKKISLKNRSNLNNLLIKLENENYLKVVDLFEVFCPNDECNHYGDEGTLLYRDSSHPSFEAAERSSKKLKTILNSFIEN